jgi:Ca-activated chloride channel family protein
MSPEEREPLLTAYALNDPGLTPEQIQMIEQELADQPECAEQIHAVRTLAEQLTKAFATETVATPTAPIQIPTPLPSEPASRRRGRALRIGLSLAIAASLLAVIGVLLPTTTRDHAVVSPMMTTAPQATSAPKGEPFELAALNRADAKAPPATELPPGNDAKDAPVATPTIALEVADPVARPKLQLPSEPIDKSANRPTMIPSPHAATATAPTAGMALPRPAAPGMVPPQLGLQSQMTDGRTLQESERRGAKRAEKSAPYLHREDSPEPEAQAKKQHHPEPVRSRDAFAGMIENPFVPVDGQNALSTFGVDVDTASYAIMRKYLSKGQLPPKDAVRLEEIVNYFPYQDKAPTGDDPFAVTVELGECPWQPRHRLARIGLKAKPIATDKRPPSNLVFLIDVSGSMNEPNKLPLVKQSLKLLVQQLGENDRVAMVVYAGNAGLVLDSTSAINKGRILEALDNLEAGGSTNGAGGIQQAYEVATANFLKNGTNRVILCTDGDWNVGTTGTDALVKMIEERRKTGVFLSVFGFGMGNLRDEMMVQLAGKGNGNYGYIDTLREANKALVEQLGGTLVTVAKDVKIQVEFNPAAVKSYRLLGYEKRALAAQDFADDTKDAGEMGAGHVVTALYELVPAHEAPIASGEQLRYQPAPAVKAEPPMPPAKEAFLVKMRHKKPDGDTSTLRELPVPNRVVALQDASEDFRFSAAAATFALILRESQYKGNANFADALKLAEGATRFDPSGYRAEFLELLRKAQQLSGRP